MKRFARSFLVSIVVVCLSYGTVGAQGEIDIRSLMADNLLEASGLSKLTEDEIAVLNAWLAWYTGAILELVEDSQEHSSLDDTIESRIDGAFEGWKGDTLFKLQNGQVWQQDSPGYRYHYAYNPRVFIYKVGTRHKMLVEGIDDEIYVVRIK